MSGTTENALFSINGNILNVLHEKGETVSSLARKINIRPVTLRQQLDRPTLQVNRLWSICHAMKINFFQEIANSYEQETQNNVDNVDGAEYINIQKELQEKCKQLELLENENKTLKEVIHLLKD
ncbi:hypothetical protein [Labilibaculum antarcticum]|uniref:HTH cro/C1-type domain-containing protein n=1 Tax=Labilibaculum antarcticum TaxID=1717717 RepID=A0A1Y1CF64_9BACT|nr:hypothetical protein [Labilibaculum antarcticum]BAX78998.1 hypothetical protein ALGA_0608 [Labilibaculum antarcticum]